MGYETFPKNGQQGSRKIFSGESIGGDALTTRNNREKRDGYMKSGRMEFAGAAQNSDKFKSGKESAGRGADFSKLSYPKKGHSATKFGTTKSQGS